MKKQCPNLCHGGLDCAMYEVDSPAFDATKAAFSGIILSFTNVCEHSKEPRYGLALSQLFRYSGGARPDL